MSATPPSSSEPTLDLDHSLAMSLSYLRQYSKGKVPDLLRQRIGESDLVQETMLGATHSIGQFQGTSVASFRKWLKEIFHNRVRSLVRDHVRCQKRTVKREISLDFLDVPDRQTFDAPSTAFHDAENFEIMEQTFQMLPETFRELIELHYRQGLSHREIALRMNKSEVAIRKCWSRAIQRWKELVTKRENAIPPA